MNGLEQVKQAVAGALNQAGLAVRTAFEPGWAARCDRPVAAVGLRTGESRGGAMGRYLGQTPDRREVYGLNGASPLGSYTPQEFFQALVEHYQAGGQFTGLEVTETLDTWKSSDGVECYAADLTGYQVLYQAHHHAAEKPDSDLLRPGQCGYAGRPGHCLDGAERAL